MTLNNFDTVFYTLAFLVPGFIWYSALSMIVPQKTEQSHLSFLRFLTLSSINYGFWSWLIYLMHKSDFFKNNFVLSAAAWFLIIFISPVFLGFLSGRFSQEDTVRKALQRIGFNPIHAIPTCWDYKFSKINKDVWILVTLKDGSTVAGLFGSKSFASSEMEGRDIYIQEVFKINSDGGWERIQRSPSILIKADEIKYIEFWEDIKKEEANA